MSSLRSSLMFVSTILALSSCGDDKKGKSLGIPAIKPPVDAATPAGLANEELSLLACGNESGTPIERLKARVFCPGPGDFSYRLGMVDSRMSEFNTRSEESEKKCISEEAKLWQPQMPVGEEFPMYFSCREDMGNGLTVLFGQYDGYSYIAELQNPSGDNFGASEAPDMAVLARIDNTGEQVDVWTISVEDNQSTWLKITANKTSKSMEAVLMGSSQGYGLGCGVNLITNEQLIFVDGIVNDYAFPGACSGYQDPDDQSISLQLTEACLDATSLEDKGTQACVSENMSTFAFSKHKYENVVVWDQAEIPKDIVKGVNIPDGITNFNDE